MKLFFIFDRLEWDEYVRIFYTHSRARRDILKIQAETSIHPPTQPCTTNVLFSMGERSKLFSPDAPFVARYGSVSEIVSYFEVIARICILLCFAKKITKVSHLLYKQTKDIKAAENYPSTKWGWQSYKQLWMRKF